jgi:hypothetical protein
MYAQISTNGVHAVENQLVMKKRLDLDKETYVS